MENSLLSIPKEKKLKPAFVLALLVHLALLVFLWIGVSWQSETGDTVEAEVWDIKVRDPARPVNSRNLLPPSRLNCRRRKKVLHSLLLRQ